jgi:hypothetical protein
MPTATYIALANYTVAGSAKADITFSSIPATYRDLVLVADNLKTSSAGGENVYMNLNSDNNTGNYSLVTMSGSGSGTNSANRTDGASIILGYNAGPSTTAALSMQVHFMDYSATDKHKTILCRGSNAGVGVMASATRWANTNAITSIKIFAEATSFAVGTTFALYGIVS